MASAYWRTDHTVKTLLNEREVGWEFLQLVKLLLSVSENINGASDDEVLTFLSNNVKFKGSLASDFPPSEIRDVKLAKNGGFTDITLVNGVLSAANGPLPEPFISWVKDLSHGGDTAMADFLDLFNNRLAALRYLICRVTRPNLIDSSAEKSDSAAIYNALSGALFNRTAEADDLRLSGLLANSRMSFPVVKQLLHFRMGLPLKKMNSYQGGWLSVDKQDHSILGRSSVCALGATATLGTKVWDQQQAIELVIGPVHWAKVRDLIPGGSKHNDFVNLLRRITDCRCDCNVTLLLPQLEVPSINLGPRVSLIKDNASSIESKNIQKKKTIVSRETASEPLALGLTTVLPTAKKRVETNKFVKVQFTVETSNSGVSLVA